MGKQQPQNALQQRHIAVIILIVIFAITTIVITFSESPISLTNVLINSLVFFGIVVSIVGVIYPNQFLKILYLLLGLCIFVISIYYIITNKNTALPLLTIVLLLSIITSIFISWRDRNTARSKLAAVEGQLLTAQQNQAAIEKQLQLAGENQTSVEKQLHMTEDELNIYVDKYKYKTRLSDFAALVLVSLSILVSEDGSNKDAPGKRQRFVDDLLSTATKIFPEVYGTSIFRRDPANREYLRITEAYNVPEQNRKRAKCYVGDGKQKRGVAGEAFKNQTPLIARFEKDPADDTWKCNQDSYTPFELGTHPPFRSFACVPIFAYETTNPGEPLLGVVSFDSLSVSTFDSPEAMDALTVVARYLAVILVILDAYDDKVRREKMGEA